MLQNQVEDAFIIEGGRPLKGNVRLSGAKNVALKTIIAALLFDGKVHLHNIPRIGDVFELLNLIKMLGAQADFVGYTNEVVIDSMNLKEHRLDFLFASKIRVSFMLFAPLLYRFGRALIPNPGGCRIGARPINRIIEGMKDIGIPVEYNSSTGYYQAIMKQKPTGTYIFDKTSHTGTELMILLSVFCQSDIIIKNCALEPEIDDLIAFLNGGGAHIRRDGLDMVVSPCPYLFRETPYTIVCDRNEAITFASAALMTKGDVTVSSIPQSYIRTFVKTLEECNGGVEEKEGGIWRFYYKGNLKNSHIITYAHPGFMTDWQPNWAVLMTQAEGESTIHERVFENRFAYVDELVKVGAKIEFYQPEVDNPETFYGFNYDKTKNYTQAIKVHGPQILHNGVMTVADLRAGATLALAALSADGESVINGVSILERGYEHFVEKITQLGGNIRKI